MPRFRPFLLCLAALIDCDFGVLFLSFIQEIFFHPLDHAFSPIPASLPLLPLSLLYQLPSKSLAVVPPLFHFPAGLPTTSPLVVAVLNLLFITHEQVSISVSSIFGIEHPNAPLSARLHTEVEVGENVGPYLEGF